MNNQNSTALKRLTSEKLPNLYDKLQASYSAMDTVNKFPILQSSLSSIIYVGNKILSLYANLLHTVCSSVALIVDLHVGRLSSCRCPCSPGYAPTPWSGGQQSESTQSRRTWSGEGTVWPHPLCCLPFRTSQSWRCSQQHP